MVYERIRYSGWSIVAPATAKVVGFSLPRKSVSPATRSGWTVSKLGRVVRASALPTYLSLKRPNGSELDVGLICVQMYSALRAYIYGRRETPTRRGRTNVIIVCGGFPLHRVWLITWGVIIFPQKLSKTKFQRQRQCVQPNFMKTFNRTSTAAAVSIVLEARQTGMALPNIDWFSIARVKSRNVSQNAPSYRLHSTLNRRLNTPKAGVGFGLKQKYGGKNNNRSVSHRERSSGIACIQLQ